MLQKNNSITCLIWGNGKNEFSQASDHTGILLIGVARIWQGGQELYFFRLGNLHVALRHAHC